MRRSVPSRLCAAVGRGRARRLASRGGVGSPPSTPLGCRSLATGPSEGMTLSPSCVIARILLATRSTTPVGLSVPDVRSDLMLYT